MKIEWDANKRQSNLLKHGQDFILVHSADFDKAKVVLDDRFDYGETRYNMFVPIHERLFVMSFTWRDDVLRVISLRKANKREERFYHDT